MPTHEDTEVQPMTLSVDSAVQVSGLSRTELYKAMSSGDLASVVIGRRRLILPEDLRAWLLKHRVGK